MRAAAALITLLALTGWAYAQTAGKSPAPSDDDAIAQVLRKSEPAQASPDLPPSKGASPIVMDARIGEHADRTRFVLELSDPIDLRVFTLIAPNRVVIDLPQVQWHISGPPRPSANGTISSYRFGLFRPGNSRVVIDLNQPVNLSETLVLPPQDGHGYRFYIDLFPTTQAKFSASAGWPNDLRERETAAQMASLPSAPVPSPKKIVVIDAGHGGIDPGTNGANGLVEKDLVLSMALRLKSALQSRNYTVYLTRDSDTYIPLRQRIDISRGYKADLFISLHADSNPDPDLRGLSVYTLSEQGSDKEASALANKENQSDIIAGVDLSGENSAVAPILTRLVQRDTMNKSSRFAESVVGTLRSATDILPRQPHRSAAFVVLKAPDVPAVLIELGYLSNASDAKQMKTAGWRNRIADAIASAVDQHFAPTETVSRVASGSE